MKCLIVKAPFAGWIVDGVKLTEYRTRETHLCGRIGIIESGTGTVIGDVELKDCIRNPQQGFYLWLLRNPRRYTTPVPFEHKQGCVTCAILDIDPDQQEIAPRLPHKEFWREAIQFREIQNKWLLEHTQHLANGGAE